MTVPQAVDQEVPEATMELDLDAQGPAADLVRV